MEQEKSAMQTFKKLILFFGCNIIGFQLLPLIYVLSLKTGIIDLNDENLNTSEFFFGAMQATENSELLPVPVMLVFPLVTWAICALFSFAYFFVGKKWRRFFLLAPLILPALHSLIIMLKFA
jgi:hypothetical protein